MSETTTGALDRKVIRDAVKALKRAHAHVTEHDCVGAFLDDTAEQIIERKVRWADNPKLWRAYETAVRDQATKELFGTQATRPPRRNVRTTQEERDDILERLRAGAKPRAVAKAVGLSLMSVYRVRREASA